MKRILFLLLAVALCEGCRSTYRMTLNDGEVVTALGKPQYDSAKGSWTYTDGNGKKQVVSAVAVRNVQPSSWKSSEDSKTIPYIQ